MLISLYHIANALAPLDVELELSEGTPGRYADAGGLYITENRLSLKHTGTTGICSGTDGRLLVRDISRTEFFYLIRYVFNLYNSWEGAVLAAVQAKKSLWEILELSDAVLRAPAVILDEDLSVAALNTKGFLRCEDSVGLRTLRGLGRLTRAQRSRFLDDIHYNVHQSRPWFCPENNGLPCSGSINLIHHERNRGVLTIFEGDIPFNPGHFQILEQLALLVSEYYNDDMERRLVQKRLPLAGVLSALDGQPWEEEKTDALYRECGWKEGDELVAVVFASPLPGDATMRYFRTHFESFFQRAFTLVYEETVVTVLAPGYESAGCQEAVAGAVAKLPRGYSARAGVSLPFHGMDELYAAYRQSLLAVSHSTAEQPVRFYYEDGLNELLLGKWEERTGVSGLLPAVRTLWAYDRANRSHLCSTLFSYLRYERNAAAAARAMDLHRNTMLYRLRKIGQVIQPDWEDPYVREYALVSLRLLLGMAGTQ